MHFKHLNILSILLATFFMAAVAAPIPEPGEDCAIYGSGGQSCLNVTTSLRICSEDVPLQMYWLMNQTVSRGARWKSCSGVTTHAERYAGDSAVCIGSLKH